MMAIKHPANPRFLLFHLIDQHWKDNCYIITCLKSANSLAHVMIAALLPYVKWILEARHGKVTTSQVPKWFKPSSCICTPDTYWDPKKNVFGTKATRCSIRQLPMPMDYTGKLMWWIWSQPKERKSRLTKNQLLTLCPW